MPPIQNNKIPNINQKSAASSYYPTASTSSAQNPTIQIKKERGESPSFFSSFSIKQENDEPPSFSSAFGIKQEFDGQETGSYFTLKSQQSARISANEEEYADTSAPRHRKRTNNG
jgi:hypothetical protein